MEQQRDARRTVSEPILIVTVGAFGRAVGRRIEALDRHARALEDAGALTPTASARSPRAVVLAASRPLWHRCEEIEERAFACGWPFVPAILESRSLTIGPIVVPGAGACWSCWHARSKQHDRHGVARAALAAHYRDHPDAEPKGFLEPFALLTAARISQAIDRLDSAAGEVWRLDVITREATTSQVVGLHNCPRCGLHRPAEERTVGAMRRAVANSW
jgi:bacteriocin biosynthesis cyclodehydratase domain-containing protein